MRRREFIAGLGSAVVPLEARAQLGDRARRIGMLLPYDQNDPVAKTRVSAFMQALAELGWTDGHNVRMDLGWAGGDINRIRALAHELVALQPDIVVAGGTLTIAALQRETPLCTTHKSAEVGRCCRKSPRHPADTQQSNHRSPLSESNLRFRRPF